MLKRLVETSLNWFFHGLSEMINGQDLQPVHPKTGSTLTNGSVFFSLFLLGSVRFRSFFRSSELDLKTLIIPLRMGLLILGNVPWTAMTEVLFLYFFSLSPCSKKIKIKKAFNEFSGPKFFSNHLQNIHLL